MIKVVLSRNASALKVLYRGVGIDDLCDVCKLSSTRGRGIAGAGRWIIAIRIEGYCVG